MEHPGNKPPPKLSVVFRFWSSSSSSQEKYGEYTRAFSKRVQRKRTVYAACIHFRLCRKGTGRANINQWSQEWNQGGRVVPHNAATGEVRERCTPCLVSVSMLLSTHAQAHVHARTRHPYSYVQSWRCIVHATASPSHAITWETNKRIHRCSRTHTLGVE